MSALFNGAECAMPANPLSQVLKHTEGDQSGVQRDRFAGPSSAGPRQFQSGPAPTAEQDLAMTRQFFDMQQHSVGSVPMPMNMPPQVIAAGLAHRMRQEGPMPTGQLTDGFRDFQASMQPVHMNQPVNQGWMAEFNNASSSSIQAGSSSQAAAQFTPQSFASSALPYNPMSMPMGMGRLGMNGGLYSPSLFANTQTSGKGKGKAVDFDAAFDAAIASLPQQQAEARIEEVADGVEGVSAALQEATLDESTSFQKVWTDLQNSDLPPPDEDMAKWEAEFNQLMTAQRDELDQDFAGPMQAAWEQGLGEFGEDGDQTSLKFDDEGVPVLGEYVFDKENQHMSPETTGPTNLEQAKALLARNGSLSEAALLLEAAIQKGELGQGGYETWLLLGETRTMDEREEAGMRALQEGVKQAEAVGAKGEGMLSLAISFTNESYDRGAHTMLLRWLQARFPQYPIPAKTIASLRESSWQSHDLITEAYLAVARAQHAEGTMDPDVQIGLGVLFYNNTKFDQAKDCFESALSVRPQDYLLWNRLGSALSNGNKPEEALSAYREALNLRPTYTRAIYNVGVACLNIGAYKEASEHFLSALGLQESTTGGDKSDQIWFTLRRALLAMDRFDLADQAKAGTNLDAFRSEGFDF